MSKVIEVKIEILDLIVLGHDLNGKWNEPYKGEKLL